MMAPSKSYIVYTHLPIHEMEMEKMNQNKLNVKQKAGLYEGKWPL